MIESRRAQFNAEFSSEKYQAFLDDLAKDFNYAPTFRLAETPFFIPNEIKSQLEEACGEVIDFIKRSDFKKLTQRAIDLNTSVPNEDAHTQFMAIDFGICEENGTLIPKLIEVQGFPSIFNFQFNLYRKIQQRYPFLSELTPYMSELDEDAYLELLRKVVMNGHDASEVILLEIEPEKQNTKIDFYYCQRDLGIPIICVTEVIKEGTQLFYINKSGEKKRIKRIYNRVIFDELDTRKDLSLQFSFEEKLDVEWAGHPNWYTRISKFILPYLQGKYFIETSLLSELKEVPKDLENYVLKPLFSFSGSGVVFNVKKSDIDNVRDKDLYILQKKVAYAPVIQSPDGKVKVEVRVLVLWPEGDENPTLVGNLARLSRGEMIGVKFNKDKDWVGGSIGLFEK
ncbi:hypothetical protein LV84_04243 [Algoriphagus ratkowskyi]|uniref:Circularly permuted ATP-grasp superfamily protein n=1 Tax=Algoriphagus ratkowskyi TaxID=57028 RepID=A0A2W7R0W0_9BACT|nr:hypothetical protein [Algoriphagus ratkowskyi]PZX49557.1 hypothetical protein LV84_04243 [Algoriphagus ratkowskyi]TXD75421.1 hypothetical protein ESW18_20635 [Algoriphagus ratkowskyi]